MNNVFSNKNFFNIAIILLVAIFFFLDRYLKFFALALAPGQTQTLLGEFFTFSFTKNYYISFSLPLPGKLILIFTCLALAALLVGIFWRLRKTNKLDGLVIFLFLIFMGALSNLIDRLSFGYVIDYLNIANQLALNLADLMISLGALLAIIFYNYPSKPKPSS